MNMSRFIRRPSLWLPGVTIAFSVYASLDAYLTNALPSSVGAFILSGMVFVISGLCVSAAWDAARLHGVAKNLGRRRNMLRLLAWILIPCWIWTAVAFGVLWAYQMWLFGMVVYPHPLTVLLAALMGFVWSLMGVVFVWVFPRVVGLLLATVLPFTVTSFAWSLTDYRWRHMFGVPSACCKLSSTLSTQMVFASVLCLSGIAAIGASVVAFRRGNSYIPSISVPRVLCGVVSIIGIGSIVYASVVAQSIENFAAAQPRDTREAICRDGMCSWPENTDAEIQANRSAYSQILATMPPEWLPSNDPVIMPDPNYKIGAIDMSLWILGETGSALPFSNSTDPAEAYRHFAGTLAARESELWATAISSDAWQEWAARQTRPATPEEVLTWVNMKKNEL